MAKREYQLLRELRRLSPEAQGEVLEYAKWLRDVEAEERLFLVVSHFCDELIDLNKYRALRLAPI
jgi:hypothetical protein